MLQTKFLEEMKTHLVLNSFYYQKSCRLWDNVEKYRIAGEATDENIISRTRFECPLTNATDTHSGYAILIGFQWQQWLRERASILRYTYIACAFTYKAWNALRTMLRTYLIIRGFYVGENSYTDVLRRWLVGYQRFGQARCLYLVAGSGGDVTSKYFHVPDRLHGVVL